MKFFKENIIKNEKFEFSYRMIASDGRIVWIKERVNNIIELDGIKRINGMMVDITKDKIKKSKLIQNQILLEESQKIAKLGGWELDILSGELFWTAETYRIHETSPEEFNPTVDAGVGYFLPESKETIIAALDKAINEGIGYDLYLETYTTKGSKIDVRTTCIVTMIDGKPIKLTGIFQDVTEQTLKNKELFNSTSRLNLATNASKIGIWERDVQTNATIWDDTMYQIYKIVDKSKFIFDDWFKMIFETDVQLITDYTEKVLDSNEAMFVEFRIKLHDDSIRYIESNVVTMRDKQGKPIKIIGTNLDVTEQKEAGNKLKESEEKYKTLFENNPMPLVVYNRQTLLIQDINQASVEKYGHNKEDIIGKTILDIRPKENIDKVTNLIVKKTDGIENAGVWKHQKKNGDIIDVEVFRKSIIYNGEDSILGLLNDVTEKLKAEAELILHKKVVDNSLEGIIITDPNQIDNPTIYINEKFTQITGYTKDDIIGKNCRIIQGAETNQEVLNELRKSIKEKREFEGELLNYRKDGSTFWNYLRISTIKNNDGIVTHFVGFQNDITEKKIIQLALIEREKALNDIIEFSPIPIVLSRISDGELILVNSSFEKLIGADKNYLIGRKSIEFYAEPNDREEIINLMKNFGKIESIDIKLKRIDSLIIDCLMSVENIKYNNENVNLITLVDISVIKETELTLINARVEAERVSKLKSSFLANMSHELRTPMNGILGFSNFISTLDDIEDIREMSSFINVSALRLMETLNLILDISTIESGVAKIILEEMDLIELINDNIQLFKVNADSKNITITFNKYFDQLIINSNRQAIQSIISNLINNAIKFTNVGGISIDFEIVIEEYKVGNTVKWAIIKVSDTGIGIEQENLEVIFDEFRQVSEGHNRSFEGTGLGLSLTKKYVELLGSSIGVVSKINEGTTFTVKIPINQTEWVNPKVIETIDKVENIEVFKPNKHILVVEDDYPSLRLIELLLKGKCVVDSSSKPLDAIEKAKAKNYDLIITDINLGRGLNGLYVTRELRKMPQYKDTAIIAMTAYAMKGDKEEFLEAGCTDYISKPIDQKLLVSMVQDYLNKE
ncbi:MAG: PAS domain S-box protein [Candidatus Kapabacteria bacterium]|nr:PAS domain S-box protein [Candidatus Kapabacteria bacterium]